MSDFAEEKKNRLKDNINTLQSRINETLNIIGDPSTLVPDDDVLPGFNLNNVKIFDYEKELESIRIDAKETLNCLANLYLDDEIMRDKNINVIIKDDANKIAELNFSISCSKRALMQLMQHIDIGTTNAELYKAVSEAQKVMTETIKAAHELLNVKMKKFYMELRDELNEINTGDEVDDESEEDSMNIIGDPKKLNKLIEQIDKEKNQFKK